MSNWKLALLPSCFNNINLSITILLLTPIALYKNAEKAGEPPLPWMLSILVFPPTGAYLRHRIAKKAVIEEHFCVSCCIWTCCPCLGLVQESRNLGTMEGYQPQRIERGLGEYRYGIGEGNEINEETPLKA